MITCTNTFESIHPKKNPRAISYKIDFCKKNVIKLLSPKYLLGLNPIFLLRKTGSVWILLNGFTVSSERKTSEGPNGQDSLRWRSQERT